MMSFPFSKGNQIKYSNVKILLEKVKKFTHDETIQQISTTEITK